MASQFSDWEYFLVYTAGKLAGSGGKNTRACGGLTAKGEYCSQACKTKWGCAKHRVENRRKGWPSVGWAECYPVYTRKDQVYERIRLAGIRAR